MYNTFFFKKKLKIYFSNLFLNLIELSLFDTFVIDWLFEICNFY